MYWDSDAPGIIEPVGFSGRWVVIAYPIERLEDFENAEMGKNETVMWRDGCYLRATGIKFGFLPGNFERYDGMHIALNELRI